jgi:hypothetical protein
MFEELYSDPARLEQFMHAMEGASPGNFQALAEKFDFSSYRTLCDVGGATGQLSAILATRYPHLRCTSFDLPVVAPIAERTIAAAGLAERVVTASGDFFVDPFPRAKVITMSLILHDWDLARKDAPDQVGLPGSSRGRRVHRHRVPHRRRSPGKRFRADDVA